MKKCPKLAGGGHSLPTPQIQTYLHIIYAFLTHSLTSLWNIISHAFAMNPKFSHCAALLLGVAIGAIFSNFNFGILSVRRRSSVQDAFVLGVTVKFKTEKDKNTFKTILEPVAEYVAKFELNTISYEMLESDKDPTQIYMLERYRTKKDYLDVHRKSKQFLLFRDQFQKMIADGAVLDGHSYIESNVGFV